MSAPIIFFIGMPLSLVLTMGWKYAYFQREFPAIADDGRKAASISAIMWGIMCGALGWVGLTLTFLLSEFAKHGWLLPFTKSKT